MADHSNLILAIAAVALILLGALLFRALSRGWRRFLMRRRFRRGAKGEEIAGKYLLKHGFRILESQSRLRPCMYVDGQAREYPVRADYVVSKRGRRGVVEVKTGKSAPNPTDTGTRRQILEYAHFYDVDDVYLFDAERRSLMTISFGGHIRRTRRSVWPWVVAVGLGFAAGCAVMLYVL